MFTKEGEMTHRHAWEIGTIHVATLRSEAAHERGLRAAAPSAPGTGVRLAALARRLAATFERLADRLDRRPAGPRAGTASHPNRAVPPRPSGA